MLKPVMKFLHKKGHRFEVTKRQIPVPETLVEPEIAEADQNSVNEALESRLQEDLINKTEKSSGMIGVWMQGQMTLVPVSQGRHIPIPVHFACTPSGDFVWSPLPDSDIYWCASEVQTTGQTLKNKFRANQLNINFG
ncbi:hypothetical protein L9F63_026568 [Diploptera punctata]|uniref:Uncharacterized protein n=1 Tax=Diploptera punctata TaxID=6984 RepID=A0AAD8AJM0_DIPPU|nr:hypothetical protein L9F63_026568 [Diploptera punctata]